MFGMNKYLNLEENLNEQIRLSGELLTELDIYNEEYIVKAQELAKLVLEFDQVMRENTLLPERWVITKVDVPSPHNK